MAGDKRQRELARLYGGSELRRQIAEAEVRSHTKEMAMARIKRQTEVASGAHRQRTEESLVLGGFAIVLVVGGALMMLVLGKGPATLGIGVILLVIGIFLMLYKGLGMLDAWLKRDD